MMDDGGSCEKSCMEHLWWCIPPTAHLHVAPVPSIQFLLQHEAEFRKL